jgi:carbon-monoxide dehydrogenase small subunit
MERPVTLTVNGEKYRLMVEPSKTLLEIIRDDLGLTGTKEGCGGGDCGACTVLLNGRAVPSCIVLGVDADGCDVVTIEGLATGIELHPIQRAFVDHGAVQCGFCTPGMIMSAKGLLDGNPSPTEEEIKNAIEGNFCRCTGYAKIIEAIKSCAGRDGECVSTKEG